MTTLNTRSSIYNLVIMEFVFKSITAFNDFFKSEKICYDYLEQHIWENGKPICPHCGSEKYYKVKPRGKNKDIPSYRCAIRSCDLPFSVRNTTMFEGSKVELRKWFMAMYLISINKKGVNSETISKAVDVSRKTAWLMLHKIRSVLSDNLPELLEDEVQVDETFVGGKNKNRHADKKVKNSRGRSFKDKTPVFGILTPNKYEYTPDADGVAIPKVKEHSKIKCFVVRDTKATTLQPIILKNVKKGSTIISDEWTGYSGLDRFYDHKVVDHGRKEYVNKNGDTSNAVENAWSHLKRSLIGIYYSVKRKHLQRYCREFMSRFNQREDSVFGRFFGMIKDSKKFHATYAWLVRPPAIVITKYKIRVAVYA